jgi:hypothetical protein
VLHVELSGDLLRPQAIRVDNLTLARVERQARNLEARLHDDDDDRSLVQDSAKPIEHT